LSAAYPLLGWLPAVRFIPCKGYAADKAWISHDRLESESVDPCVSRLTSSVAFIRSGIRMVAYFRFIGQHWD